MLYLYGIMDLPMEMYQKIIDQSHCRGSLSFQNLSLLYAKFRANYRFTFFEDYYFEEDFQKSTSRVIRKSKLHSFYKLSYQVCSRSLLNNQLYASLRQRFKYERRNLQKAL